VILNPSRTHTTFGKHTTDLRTTSGSAHQQFLQKYNSQERKGMITPATIKN